MDRMAIGSLVKVSPMEEWTHNFYNATQRFKSLRSWTNDGKVIKSHFTLQSCQASLQLMQDRNTSLIHISRAEVYHNGITSMRQWNCGICKRCIVANQSYQISDCCGLALQQQSSASLHSSVFVTFPFESAHLLQPEILLYAQLPNHYRLTLLVPFPYGTAVYLWISLHVWQRLRQHRIRYSKARRQKSMIFLLGNFLEDLNHPRCIYGCNEEGR